MSTNSSLSNRIAKYNRTYERTASRFLSSILLLVALTAAILFVVLWSSPQATYATQAGGGDSLAQPNHTAPITIAEISRDTNTATSIHQQFHTDPTSMEPQMLFSHNQAISHPHSRISATDGVDLIVTNITVEPDNPEPGDLLDIIVTIKNDGTEDMLDSDRVIVELFLLPDDAGEPDEMNPIVSFPALRSGEEFTFTSTLNDPRFPTEPGCYDVWAWVQFHPDNLSEEATTDNNKRAIPVGICYDSYEHDDNCVIATPITPDGTIQRHNFHQAGDSDWVQFDAISGTTYLIEAQVPAGSQADVALEFYTQCQQEQPDDQQDYTFAPGGRMLYTAYQNGTIYLKFTNADPQVAGADVFYNLSVAALGTQFEPSALIVVAGRLKTNDPLQRNFHNVAQRVIETFTTYGYTDDDIFFLAPDPTLDGFDAMPTRANLEHIITSWAKERVDANRALTIYLIGQGDTDGFYLDKPYNEVLTPYILNGWLDHIRQAKLGTHINVIVDASYAGIFIDSHISSISYEPKFGITFGFAKLNYGSKLI